MRIEKIEEVKGTSFEIVSCDRRSKIAVIRNMRNRRLQTVNTDLFEEHTREIKEWCKPGCMLNKTKARGLYHVW